MKKEKDLEPRSPLEPPSSDARPFPDSLCHTCAAPPKYIRTPRSVFLFCPLFRRYPPQPVVACPKYVHAAPEPSP